MAKSINWWGLLLAVALMGCDRDKHDKADRPTDPSKPFVNLKDEDTMMQSLYEVADSAGTQERKNQIMLGMERMAARAAAEEEYLVRLRAKTGTSQSHPVLTITTIAQLLKQDERVRLALDGKTADDFMSSAMAQWRTK